MDFCIELNTSEETTDGRDFLISIFEIKDEKGTNGRNQNGKYWNLEGEAEHRKN